MEARRWLDVVATFDELVELEPEKQEQRLTEIGKADAQLRRRVEELLAADAEAEERLAPLDDALSPRRLPRHEEFEADPLHLVGRTVSHFRVIEPLAHGGMGVVYRAEDTQLKRRVALKFPLPAPLDRSTTQRFLREARVGGALDHPNLCAIHEVGETEDGHLFYAMPLYEGETLKERLAQEGALPIADALAISRQMATGLAAAHKAGIVHRDLKPANVMLLRDGSVRILDFGLARSSDLTLTDPWATLGTVAYMAPEQIQGQAVDHRADLWALGVVVYEMLTGRRPFQGEQAITVAHAIVHDEPVPPSSLRGEIMGNLDTVVQTLLGKDPAQRYPSAEDVASAFDARWLAPRPDETVRGDGTPKHERTVPASSSRLPFRLTRLRAVSGIGALAILLGAFTVSRALGIGPASLLARGNFHPSDSLLVADFEIHGQDPSLGRTISSMVGTALSQSNVVSIVPYSRIRPALERMRRPVAEPLVSAVAREIAQREGFKAVVDGELSALGAASFVVNIRVVSPEGDQLTSASETTSVEDLPDTIDQLTRLLRGRMGEPLKHIRASAPLPQVTSQSIEAVRKYAEGVRALHERNDAVAEVLLNEAVALDSTFATAWVALFYAYWSGRYPQERWKHALEHAWRHRDRLTEKERYNTEGAYYRVGPGSDRVRAAQAYEAGLRLDTGYFANNLGLLYQSRREYARAESLFRWYVSRGSTSLATYENLAAVLYFQGKRAESESVAAEIPRRWSNAAQWLNASSYLYNRGQLDSAQLMLERAGAVGDVTRRRFSWRVLASLHQVRGRLADAERARSRAAEANIARGVADSGGEQLWLASLDIWYRDRPEDAVRRLEQILVHTPQAPVNSDVPVPYFEPYSVWVARLFAQAHRPDRARELLAAFGADTRDTVEKRRAEPAVHAAQGEIALAEGRPMDALAEFRRADRLPDGPIHLSALSLSADAGRAFDRGGMADSAIASFERYINTPQLDRARSDATYLPHILQRLGALYEAKGERTKAVAYYRRFVELWRNADTELQPQLAMVRKRIESLQAAEARRAARGS